MNNECKCSAKAGSNLRMEVFLAEKEYLSMVSRKGALASYQKLVSTVKSTWGLCSYCDQKLREMVLNYGR